MHSRFLSLVFLALACAASLAEEKSPWLARPKQTTASTAADKRAREELLMLLDKRQEPQFRKDFKIVVPEHGTGLPADYDVLVYGKYVDWDASRIRLQVRGGKVQAELASEDEIRRGELPADAVDHLVRTLLYGFLARDTPRKEDEFEFGPTWSVFVSHAPQIRMEVLSRTKRTPLHLKTEDWPLVVNRVESNTAGTIGFTHTLFGKQLGKLAQEKLPVIEPNEEERKELVRRLKAITPPKDGGVEDDSRDADPATRPLDDYRRDDLPAVEALIYSKLAIAWRVKEAAAELKRLSMREASAQLAIVTADDPRALLEAALAGGDSTLDWRMFRFALEFTAARDKPQDIDLLVQSLTKVKDDYRREDVLKRLREAKLTPTQIGAIEEFKDQTKSLPLRIKSMGVLLDQAGREKYYNELLKLAQDSADRESYGKAVDALLSFSIETGKRKDESLQLARTLLDRRPADYWLAGYIAQLGNKDDLPRLRRSLRENDQFVTAGVIDAIARIDAAEGLRLARERVQEFVKSSQESYRFSNYVVVYSDLFFWQHDRTAIVPLQQAIARTHDDPNYEDYHAAHMDLLLKYLRADSAADRLPLALEYVRKYRSWQHDEWIRDVGRQLVKDGADPAACEELLNPAKRPKR